MSSKGQSTLGRCQRDSGNTHVDAEEKEDLSAVVVGPDVLEDPSRELSQRGRSDVTPIR
jgi:hypothetical protein